MDGWACCAFHGSLTDIILLFLIVSWIMAMGMVMGMVMTMDDYGNGNASQASLQQQHQQMQSCHCHVHHFPHHVCIYVSMVVVQAS